MTTYSDISKIKKVISTRDDINLSGELTLDDDRIIEKRDKIIVLDDYSSKESVATSDID